MNSACKGCAHGRTDSIPGRAGAIFSPCPAAPVATYVADEQRKRADHQRDPKRTADDGDRHIPADADRRIPADQQHEQDAPEHEQDAPEQNDN